MNHTDIHEMVDAMTLFGPIMLGVTVLSIILLVVIARKRGLSTGFWFVMGLLFGPLALPFVFFGKPKKKKAEQQPVVDRNE